MTKKITQRHWLFSAIGVVRQFGKVRQSGELPCGGGREPSG